MSIKMGNNILSTIINIEKFHSNDLRSYSSTYLNRINAVGEQLEFFVKDAISNSFRMKQIQKEKEYAKVFSYLGNQNNPPDMVLKQGDAFEIKKTEGEKSVLQLNSSPPKDMLHASDTRIIDSCRKCDGGKWEEKDLFYVIGSAKGGILRYIFFVHGLCYAAEKSIYNRVHEPLKQKITPLLRDHGLEYGETVELGKVKKVDPLGITELRIRGMWSIQNPLNVFSYIYKLDKSKKFSLVLLITKEKYNSYPVSDINLIESTRSISVSDVKVKNPNNPAAIINCKLVRLEW